MQVSGVYGGFYRISIWITRFASVNLLWFLFTLPFFFFVYNLLLVQTVNEMIVTGFIVLTLAPFIFFPATTALFSVTRRWIMKEDIRLISTFWKYYKQEYKMSMVGGIWISLICLLLGIDFYFYLQTSQSDIFLAFLVIVTFLFSIVTIHFFSIIVHAKTKIIHALKNAMLITITNPFLTLKIGIASGIVIYLSFFMFAILIPFFMGAIIAYVAFSSFYHSYSGSVSEA